MKVIYQNFQSSTLMVSLLLFFFLYPFVEDAAGSHIVFQLFFSWIILNTVYSISDHKYLRILALILAIPPLVIRWSAKLSGDPTLATFSVSALTLLLLLVAIMMLLDVLAARRVNAQVIYGAVCVYLLLALLSTHFFDWLISLDPSAFSGNPDSFSDLLYFSIVTITTLGYGDISPVSTAARTLVSLEALIGQLYLTVLLARLVGLQVAQSTKEE